MRAGQIKLLSCKACRAPAGADAIDPHIWREADGKSVRECEQSAFAGRVGFGVGFRHQCAGQGNSYDRAVGFAQRPFRRARQKKRGGQIGIEHAMPFRERQLAKRLADHDAEGLALRYLTISK